MKTEIVHTGAERQPDPREEPIYTISEAARYVGVPRTTVKSWALGECGMRNGVRMRTRPVLEHVDRDLHLFSFFDLVELHILRAAAEKKVPMRNIRRGLDYVRNANPQDQRPLLTRSFYTDGKYLLIRGLLESDDPVNASLAGQIEFGPIIDEYLGLILRDADYLPEVLYPKRGEGVIAIDRQVLSGRPVIRNTRIPVEIVANRLAAGDTIERLAEEYRLETGAIEAAIRYRQAA